ncbi:MAG TPA: ATP-grasp domain-containing protein [Candidatus Binatia bacterium]|nr:ATP-grasp domain-containing protein [Candidatus Binatia bacterium]
MNVLVEAVGSPAWATLVPYLRAVATRIVALDVDRLAAGLYLADHGYIVPRYSEPGCMDVLVDICRRERIDWVLPTIHEGLGKWAARREALAAEGIRLVISPPETIAFCEDKWETYRFFTAHGIPTARTSLEHEYELIKPRVGRGGAGHRRVPPGEWVDMTDCIAQEVLEGREFSVDALCDLEGTPLYIVPRERLAVESGLSVRGRVACDEEIEAHVRRILSAARFIGPVDVQCFRTVAGLRFTEINPRLAGGVSLAMAATENWFVVLEKLFRGETVQPRSVRNGLLMLRHYTDCIVEPEAVLQ